MIDALIIIGYYLVVGSLLAILARSWAVKLCDRDTIIVQLVAFSQPTWQLNEYLSVMKDTGFEEIQYKPISDLLGDRLWRSIPNRKWYATQNNQLSSGKEVVLIHKPT